MERERFDKTETAIHLTLLGWAASFAVRPILLGLAQAGERDWGDHKPLPPLLILLLPVWTRPSKMAEWNWEGDMACGEGAMLPSSLPCLPLRSALPCPAPLISLSLEEDEKVWREGSSNMLRCAFMGIWLTYFLFLTSRLGNSDSAILWVTVPNIILTSCLGLWPLWYGNSALCRIPSTGTKIKYRACVSFQGE